MTKASIQVCVQLSHMFIQAGPDLTACAVMTWARQGGGQPYQQGNNLMDIIYAL